MGGVFLFKTKYMYKVKALSVTGGNGKLYKSNEVLKADALGGKERAESLVEQGFLTKIEEPKKVVVNKPSKKSK